MGQVYLVQLTMSQMKHSCRVGKTIPPTFQLNGLAKTSHRLTISQNEKDEE